MRVIRTRNGLRLSQHGIVISELRTTPGPTHSVFDVLAAAISVLRPDGRTGLLGFAGGGMMAPLDALGMNHALHTVDLDRAAFELFYRHCPHWRTHVRWQHDDAVAWLRKHSARFDLLMEDLSIPQARNVIKPDVSWTVLPRLIRQRLQPDGIAVFNLLPPPHASFTAATARVAGEFKTARLLHLDEFENRILIAGRELPTARDLGHRLRQALRSMRSKQAERIRVRSF